MPPSQRGQNSPPSFIPFLHGQHGNRFFLASCVFPQYLPVLDGMEVAWGQIPGCLVHGCVPVPTAHSRYTQCFSWRREIKLFQDHPDCHVHPEPYQQLPAVLIEEDSLSLTAAERSLGECVARPAGKRCSEIGEFLSWRNRWPESSALWVLWICWDSPDLWLKIFSLILVVSPSFDFPLLLSLSLSESTCQGL